LAALDSDEQAAETAKDACMIAAVIHVCAIVLVSGAGLLTASETPRKPSVQRAILAVGVVGGVAMAVSGFYLLGDWGKWMEHFDFAVLDHANPKRLPSTLYFVPSTTTALGAVATVVFGRRFYRLVRELE
jgi:hypothetical protein